MSMKMIDPTLVLALLRSNIIQGDFGHAECLSFHELLIP